MEQVGRLDLSHEFKAFFVNDQWIGPKRVFLPGRALPVLQLVPGTCLCHAMPGAMGPWPSTARDCNGLGHASLVNVSGQTVAYRPTGLLVRGLAHFTSLAQLHQ